MGGWPHRLQIVDVCVSPRRWMKRQVLKTCVLDRRRDALHTLGHNFILGYLITIYHALRHGQVATPIKSSLLGNVD